MIALTGASGRLGRLVLRLLLERVDAGTVVALSRTPEALAGLGVATREADFDRPHTLPRALDGVERLLLVSTDVLSPTDRRARQHENAVSAAAAAGVGHVLYTSIARAEHDNPASVAADHRRTEATLVESGVPYTMLRNSPYTQLVLMGIETMLATGTLLDNNGDGATAYVTREDCAAVAAEVLARGGHQGAILEVTGPRAHTQFDIAALISEFSGVPVRYLPISDEATVADLVAAGMGEPEARNFATIGKAIRAGYTNLVTDTVERITGQPPTSVAEFLEARLAGRWPSGRQRITDRRAFRPARTRPATRRRRPGDAR
ncbi:NAD(P)H-binding protein [Virgisporangium aurantiacum]|uniref:NAD(P)-dependent oxidoreductase n=1 Tax=Virgisporangium aurantiacum TaxID=175570 RepID=A0A8J4E6D6_9ACTN|nr:NAD(P)H-binding protein [Virgisporangium aurantiacum]GIJ60717.1 NAD(P)-dependent oxidoreductase [Virgisporangium aurantiacum]